MTMFGGDITLLLNDNDDAIACRVSVRYFGRVSEDGYSTYSRCTLHLHDLDAFNNGGAGVVDAIKQRLAAVSSQRET